MKVFGHPIHLMLIHFPSALFPMDLVCSFLAYYTGNDSFCYASFYAMAGGVILGWTAAVTGLFDLGAVAKDKPASLKKALIHGGINTVVLIAYTLFTVIAFKKYPQLVKDDVLKLILKSVFVALMIVGNFIGGSLVLKDKVLDKN
jgi:uncharacterized membrane protein